MNHIIHHAYQHAHHYKSTKSIYNILIGKKSHQTFFDACSQSLLSLYHSLPQLKYPSFERCIEQPQQTSSTIMTHPRFTYDSMNNTFKALQLLIQTISNTQHDVYQFTPITQQRTIHSKVKAVYQKLKTSENIVACQQEIENLFYSIKEKNGFTYLHYYLQGFEESMYTRQQVSLIEGISQIELFEYEIMDLVQMLYEIEDSDKYPILNQLIILPKLLNRTRLSYKGILEGKNMHQLAQGQNVKINTIEDHVLELFIKGYLTNYENYLDPNKFDTFSQYYIKNKSEKLKIYKTLAPDLSYFEIKLAIVGIERGFFDI